MDTPTSSTQNLHPVDQLLTLWRAEPTIAENIILIDTIPSRSADLRAIPDDVPHPIQHLLIRQGINSLYSHQVETWEDISEHKNVVIVTGTASGKSLCYNLPVFSRFISNQSARALYLFPTKALAQDQANLINRWNEDLPGLLRVGAGIYDGDTPSHQRPAIRKNARIILSNPDMLHTGILPHHTNWAEFFKSLEFVVIDEIHSYRGVFGSHLTNVIRRLKRIARFYGSSPQFILTSATIANPVEHARRLIELPVAPIFRDGSPSGARHLILYNPPVINPDLGIRAGVLQESTRLMNDLLVYHIPALQFVRTRRSVEIMLKYLELSNHAGTIQGYRSGYLPGERRAIESGLREGRLAGVVATNALELGIDIGSVNGVVLSGYPGTIASTRQQIGRAGRRSDDSVAVMVASSDPIDQYLVQHPEYLLERSPEKALLDANNLVILLNHLRCAVFELPFTESEIYGDLNSEILKGLLEFLQQSGELHHAGEKYFWMADQYPAAQMSLRSSSPTSIVLHAVTDTGETSTVGTVDEESACWMVHPEAVYLHAGQSYLVEMLDLENHTATLRSFSGDYYTQPQSEKTVEKISQLQHASFHAYEKNFGEIKVTTRVKGYRKVRWYTNENLGEGSLDLPPGELVTTGYWLSLCDRTVQRLRELGAWNNEPNDYGPGWEKLRKTILMRDRYTCQVCGINDGNRPLHVHHKIPFRNFASIAEANRPENLVTLCPACHQRAETSLRIRSGLGGMSYVLHQLASLFLMCDINDIGVYADPQATLSDGKPTVAIYDMVAGGIGLSKELYEIDQQVLIAARELVEGCSCVSGCPSCVGPGGENGSGGKLEALAILDCLSLPARNE